MRYGELFAGVSGLGRAVEDVFGAEPAWFAEIDAAPSKVLAYHYPGVPNVGDVSKVGWAAPELGVDILAGGFPCQDVSLAGRRQGMKSGNRSGLWAEFARAIDIIRPSWVVIENVRGLLSARADSEVESCPWCVGVGDDEYCLRALDAVLADLSGLGFDAEWVGVRASSVGAPHGRFRVFILAWPAVRYAGHDAGRAERGVESEGATGGVGESGSRAVENTGYGFGRQAQPGTSRSDDAVGGSDRGGSGSRHDSRVTLLPTPVVNDMGDGKTVERWDEWTADMRAKHGNGNGHGRSLAIEASRLLPTPGAYDGDRGGSQHPDKRRDGGHSVTLQDAAEHLMPTPRATRGGSATEIAYGMGGQRSDDDRPQGVVAPGTDWGPYAAAVARWEAVLGRSAPSPVRMDGKGGKPRLNPELTEWMMGWPEGWVTAPEIGLSRAEQLKACGNGVVTLQAATALRHLLSRAGVPAVAGTFLGRTA